MAFLRIVATCVSCGALTTAAASAVLEAQTPLPTFEVVSIKPNNSASPNGGIRTTPNGRITMTNMALSELILYAYDIRAFQLDGGPGWVRSDRFDLLASVGHEIRPTPETVAELRAMMTRTLADRFKLSVHSEMREMAVYKLLLARADRTLGPRLQRAAVDCDAVAARGGTPPAPGALPACGIRISDGRLTARGSPLTRALRVLSGSIEQPSSTRRGFKARLIWISNGLRTAPTRSPLCLPPCRNNWG